VVRAVFIDRDGVLIRAPKIDNKPQSIKNVNEIRILPKVKFAINILKKNYKLIVITNQPDVARKKILKSKVKKINNFLLKKLDIDDLYVCYHDTVDNCNCRKPKPGMLYIAKKKWNIDLKKSFLIGDRITDIEAGKVAGCSNFFINHFYNEKKPKKKDCVYVKSFYDAALKIINKKNEKNQ
jgi:D-glycero-D-manno-heptose 1,7-bisphosphate phosphatase